MAGAQFKPPWLDQIRFMARYYLSGCQAPWSLYAEMAQPTAKEIVMVLCDLSLKEIIKEFFRPKGLRSKRHGRKGRKSRGGFRGIPDLNELYGKRLVGNTEFNRRKYGMPTQIFYVVDDVIDRVTWTVFLYEALNDLIYDSLLGVLEFQGDKCPNLRRLARKASYHVEGGAGTPWQTVNTGALQYAQGISSPADWMFIVDDGTYSVTFGAKLVAPSHSLQVRWRLRSGLTGGKEFKRTDWITVPDEGSVDLIINAVIEGPQQIIIEAEHDGGFWDIIVGDLQILEIL